MLQQHFGVLLGATACVFLVLGIYISPAFAQRRRLNRAIQAITERYNAELERSRVERQQWNGERIVLAGIIRADTARVDALRDVARELTMQLVQAKDIAERHYIAFVWLNEFFVGIPAVKLNEAREIVKKQLGK